MMNTKQDAMKILNAVKYFGHSNALMGDIFEHEAHFKFAKGGKFDLITLDKTMKTLKIDLALREVLTFPKKNKGFEKGYLNSKYVITESKTFPAIDSFEIISNGADVFKELFGQIDDKYGLVCFQMTISDHHPINSIGLKNISEAFKELCNTESDIPIAFV